MCNGVSRIIAVLSLFLSYKADMTIKDVNGLSVLDVINENVNSDLERYDVHHTSSLLLNVHAMCNGVSQFLSHMLRLSSVFLQYFRSNKRIFRQFDFTTSEAQDDITHDVTGNDNGRSAFEYMLIYQQNIKLQVVREMLKYGADPFHE
jgi:hypothetical protein